jgi:hypothetical protein
VGAHFEQVRSCSRQEEVICILALPRVRWCFAMNAQRYVAHAATAALAAWLLICWCAFACSCLVFRSY